LLVLLMMLLGTFGWVDSQKDFEFSRGLWEAVRGTLSHVSHAAGGPKPLSEVHAAAGMTQESASGAAAAPGRSALALGANTPPLPGATVIEEDAGASDPGTDRANFEPSRLVYRVVPEYPKTALRAGAQGTVVLQARIAEDGRILSVRPISVSASSRSGGATEFVKAAQEAVQKWKYEPARLNGSPVGSEAQVRVVFTLPSGQRKQR
jgi:protein TonB